ncbi:MAG: DUF4350 domain-containing protein [Gemmatimonadaceae bacterium]|nr:DUF4350 domain-containing protein [Gemmatimonadaceae bacterium]
MTGAVAVLAFLASMALHAQQLPDRAFQPRIARPAYEADAGARLCLDEGHHNFHTLDDRFWAFGDLARRDGYRVRPLREAFTTAALTQCDLLVISNAQPSDAPWRDYPLPTPSAFADAEIETVRAWVNDGGRLLLIADHMPLAGAAASLAAAFGASFTNGFAYPGADEAQIEAARGGGSSVPTLFRPADGTLPPHVIARGRDSTERVTQVRSFTGQAFRWDAPGAQPVMILPPDYVSLEPAIAWQFSASTPVRRVGGWWQGGTRAAGRGRVALFGEAAMFSAQIAGAERRPMGMNAPLAEQNAQFTLNVLHWLTGVIDP